MVTGEIAQFMRMRFVTPARHFCMVGLRRDHFVSVWKQREDLPILSDRDFGDDKSREMR
jgi:hypothetical protein